MAKQKFKLTLTNIGLIALIGIISAFIFTSSPSAFTGAATTTADLVMPFAIDAWGSAGWTDCSTQMNGKAWADQYCQAKGYASAQSCYLENKMERWKWAGTAAAPQKGTSTGGGVAFTKVKCVSAATYDSKPTTTPTSSSGLITKTVTKSVGATGKNSLSVTFDKEYKNVGKIEVAAIPGGEFCKAKFFISEYPGTYIADPNYLPKSSTFSFYTGVVDTHKTATKTYDILYSVQNKDVSALAIGRGIAVSKVTASPRADSDQFTVDCGQIDYLKVTLTYTEGTN